MIVKKRNYTYYYPTYFNKKKTRSEGRRVHMKLATENPNIEKLIKAAAKLNLNYKFEDKAYSKEPWVRGRLAVENGIKKNVLIKKLAQTLKKLPKK